MTTLPPDFEAIPTPRRSHPLIGIVCLFFGTFVPFSIAAVLFANGNRPADAVPWYQIILLIAVYTFAFTIGGIFLIIGVVLILYRQTNARDRHGRKYLSIAKLGGVTLATQTVTLLDQENFETAQDLPDIPASIVTLANHLHTYTNTTVGCLTNALFGLIAQGSAKIWRAEASVLWPRFLNNKQFHLQEFLILPGETANQCGGLEQLLDEKIRTWQNLERGDYPFPTAKDLAKTFEDSDGDFSHFQVHNAAETLAASRGWLQKRPRLSLSRTVPEPAPDANPKLTIAAETWKDIFSRMEKLHGEPLRQLKSAIAAVVEKRDVPKSELEVVQSRLRWRSLRILIACAVIASTVVVLAAQKT